MCCMYAFEMHVFIISINLFHLLRNIHLCISTDNAKNEKIYQYTEARHIQSYFTEARHPAHSFRSQITAINILQCFFLYL